MTASIKHGTLKLKVEFRVELQPLTDTDMPNGTHVGVPRLDGHQVI